MSVFSNVGIISRLPNLYRYFWYFQVIWLQVIDFNEFISKLMKRINFDYLYDYRCNREVYDVDQREFAVVPAGKELGTAKIRQCVAVVIKGNEKTASAHVDLNTRRESLETEIMKSFSDKESLQLRIYGPTRKVVNMKSDSLLDNAALDNVSVVLKTLESLRSRGYNINIASIQSNACIENKQLEKIGFDKLILPAEWQDIITDGDNIYQDANPPTDNPFIVMRKMIRHSCQDWAMLRTRERILDLIKFNINNFTCIDEFIKDNPQYQFYLSQEDLRESFLTMTDAILKNDKGQMENLEYIAQCFSPVYQAYLLCTKQAMSER